MRYLSTAAFIIIVLAVGVSIFVFQSEQSQNKLLISEVPAQIIEVSPRKTLDPETGQTYRIQNVLIKYRYSINGKDFEKEITLNKSESQNYKIGESAKICFNLNNHDQSKLFPLEHKCAE